ncbi:hypothetical protein RI543_000789 [Arxiozyma heterogenica]|uniref:Guanine nucleotide-binding protein alpha-2 subunit n=2 Tax=Arxiozyma heterogenica TaxID=278026 RepID=A0AAN8A7X3_9SACH|nr:hypothetical protein RI543_000789 [Kazachstania heterogenica]
MGLCGSKEQAGSAANATNTNNNNTATKKKEKSTTPASDPSNKKDNSSKESPKNENSNNNGITAKIDANNSLTNTKNEEIKVLLLGAGESGKSTILQQLKILRQNGYTEKELIGYIPIIYNNLFEIGRDLINARTKSGIDNQLDNLSAEEIESFINYDFSLNSNLQNNNNNNKNKNNNTKERQGTQEDEKNHDNDNIISNLQCFQFPSEFVPILTKLWESPRTQELINGPDSSQFYLMDSAPYFMEKSNLLRITSDKYIPSLQDILRSRQKTSGIFDTHVNMGSNLKLHFFDVGGQRSERKKWIHCFDNVTLVIFCVSLSEYDQFLVEDSEQNRFQESLVLFDNIVNSRWFSRTSIVLFLNKIDLFAEKLKRKPLENYFPDYNGGDDINKATKYILWRFVQLNRANLNIYPHVTQATDTTNIKLVFAAIKETILENSLKDTGMLQ